jgi:hypothetical protein
MTLVRITSIDAPLDGPRLRSPSIGLVRRALAVGLLSDRAVIERVDLALLRGIARAASSAGVGQDAALELAYEERPGRLATLIRRLDEALAESPMPDRELHELLRVFDVEGLAALLGTSGVSLRRYASGSRSMPDLAAARLHWLALVASDLAGAYNELGIRRWFERPRAQLGGRSPRQALGTDWDPSDPGAGQVRALAAALAGPGSAT